MPKTSSFVRSVRSHPTLELNTRFAAANTTRKNVKLYAYYVLFLNTSKLKVVYVDPTTIFELDYCNFSNLWRLEPLRLMSSVRNRYDTRTRSQQSHDRNRTVRYFWG